MLDSTDEIQQETAVSSLLSDSFYAKVPAITPGFTFHGCFGVQGAQGDYFVVVEMTTTT